MEADSKTRLLSCCPHASCIRVPSTFVGKDGATVYLLEVTWWPPLLSDTENEGLSWTLSKRFREFDALSTELAPYGTVPGLPPKQLFGNRKPSVIEARRVGVEAFLKQCIATPAISNNSVFSRFLEVDQHCDASAQPRGCLVYELTSRRVRDAGTMLGVTCCHYYLQEDVLLVTSEDQSLLSRVDSRISNLAAKPHEEAAIGGLLCYKYYGEDEGYELVAQESYQDKATALAFDQERRYIFVGLSSGHILHYYADVHWSLSAPLADIVCHSLRVSQLCLASDGLLLSISKDRTLRAIDTSGDQSCSVFHAALPTKHWPAALAWNPRRRLAYVSTLGGEILGVEVPREGTCTNEPKPVVAAVSLKGHKSKVQAIHFARTEKHLFSGGEAGAAGVWNLQHEDVRFCGLLPHGPSCAVNCVTYLRPFKLVATGYANGMVGLWDARGGQLFHVFRAHTVVNSSPTPTNATPTRRSSMSMASHLDSLSSSPPSSPKPHSPTRGHSRNHSSSSSASSSSSSCSSPKSFSTAPSKNGENYDGAAMSAATPFSWGGTAPPLVFDDPPLSPSSSATSPPPPIIRRVSRPSLPSKNLPRAAPSPVGTTTSTLLDAAAEAAAAARLEPLGQPLPDRKDAEASQTSVSAISASSAPGSPSLSRFPFPRSSSQPTLPSSCVPMSSSSHSVGSAPLWASATSPLPAAPPSIPIVGAEIRWLWFDELTYTLVTCSDQEVRFWSFPPNHCQPLHVPSPQASVCLPKPTVKFPPSSFHSPVAARTASLLSSESLLAPANLFPVEKVPVVIHANSSPTTSQSSTPVSTSPSSQPNGSQPALATDSLASVAQPQSSMIHASSSPQTSSTASSRTSSSVLSVDSVSSVDSNGSEAIENKTELADSVSRRARSNSTASLDSGSYERGNLSRRCSHGREYCSCSRSRENNRRVDPCARCMLNVFPANRVDVLGAVYHTWCLRCRQCGTTLPLPSQGQFFCSAHQLPNSSPSLPPVLHQYHDIHNIPE